MFEYKYQEKDIRTSAFFLKFVFFIMLFQGVVYIIHSNEYLSTLIQFTLTNIVAYIYQLLAEPVIVDGNTLRHIDTSRYLIVDNECTGLILLASVCAVLMAFNGPWLVKFKMAVLAIILLQGENIIRITHLLFEIKKENNDFDIYHLYIWQMINFITALLVISGVEKLYRNKEL
jgi:exosortase/archaeosortase family protein